MRPHSLTVGALAIGLLGATIVAQSVDPALTAAITGRDEATIKRDPAAMAKYTADDYAAINPSGGRMTKQQRVDQLKAPAAPGSKPAPPLRTETVRMYGAGAAVARMKQVDNRQLAVWIKNPSGWQAVAIHVVPDAFLPIAPPPQNRPTTAQPTPVTAPPGLSGEGAALFAAFKQIQDANYAGDRAAYEKSMAPEFVRIAPGLVRFGTEASNNIAGLRSQPEYSNVSVQAWDGIGVVRWLETPAAGQPQWLTRVFAKKAAGWQQVATASSPAGNPPIAP